jgi:hypothetical protein
VCSTSCTDLALHVHRSLVIYIWRRSDGRGELGRVVVGAFGTALGTAYTTTRAHALKL